MNRSDPLARLAAQAGFSAAHAIEIGLRAQASDAPGSPRDAMYNGLSWENMENWHFVTPERLAELKAEVYAHQESFADYVGFLGDYLHALEDTYAHNRGKGQRSTDENGNFDYHGQFYLYTEDATASKCPGIGHGAKGHAPDWTWTDRIKAMKEAEDVFNQLREMAMDFGETGPVSDWNDIKYQVYQFVKYQPATYTDYKFGIIPVETVTFEGYDAKIKILDPMYKMPLNYASDYKDAAHRAAMNAPRYYPNEER